MAASPSSSSRRPPACCSVRAAAASVDVKVKRRLKANAELAPRSMIQRNVPVTSSPGEKLVAAFGERAGELKKPSKRLALIDLGLIHLFMM